MDMKANFSQLKFWLIGLTVFLLPIFFLPLGSDFFDFQKQYLLLGISVILAFVFLAESLLQRKFSFLKTPFDGQIIFLSLVVFLSLYFMSPNRIDSLVFPLGGGSFFILLAFYFLVVNGLKREKVFQIPLFLYAAGALVSLFSYGLLILKFLNLTEAVPLPALFKLEGFTPLGSIFTQTMFLAVAAVGSLSFSLYLKSKNRSLFIFTAILSFVNLLGLAVSLIFLFRFLKPTILPLSFSWIVWVENLKPLQNAILGVGPGNFLSAFTLGRTVDFNSTPFWNLRFGLPGSFLFQVGTELGILGILGFGFILIKVLRQTLPRAGENLEALWTEDQTRGQADFFLLPPLLTCFFLLFFLPGNFPLLFCLILFLSLYGAQKGKEVEFSLPYSAPVIGGTMVVLLIISYIAGRAYLADFRFGQALQAVSENRGGDAYNSLISAIQADPYAERYRLSYSQLNLALANSLATKKELTDQDRTTISQLIQQSIREGKAAVSLNSQKVTNWENLASIYASLVNVAQGSDEWAISAYNQAMALDPTNPQLRLSAGGLYFQLKRFDEAEALFKVAANLKPDWANAYYNWAAVLREKGNIPQAVSAMERALSLVPLDSNDYQKAKAELEDLRAKLPKEEKAAAPSGAPETLVPPASPAAQLKEKVKLSEELAPPPAASPEGKKKED